MSPSDEKKGAVRFYVILIGIALFGISSIVQILFMM